MLRLSANFTGVLVGRWSFFAYDTYHVLVSFSCMCGLGVEVSMKNILCCSLQTIKLILACEEVLKCIWPSMSRYIMFFVQTSTLSLVSMHQKLTKHGKCYMQNNQLLTKAPFGLMINPIFLLRCRSSYTHDYKYVVA
jgi:hypothetical protein